MITLEKHAVTAAHWSQQQYEQVFATNEPRREALVIERDGIQGFLVARPLDKEWEIENMAVSGPARRHGLGTRLLGEFLDPEQGAIDLPAIGRCTKNGPSSNPAAAKGTTAGRKRTPLHIVFALHDLPRLWCIFCA